MNYKHLVRKRNIRAVSSFTNSQRQNIELTTYMCMLSVINTITVSNYKEENKTIIDFNSIKTKINK